ncbi:hypothetical protein C2D25_08440 [Escherichia coli]|uniref:Uncharacterized protein n=1 Tax=Escherichia coli TaxID=562 RepID=A0A3Q0N4G3_ECOLX|nr:hypothetical protein CR539_00180 [Escherichia coli]EFW0662427.1 hypothetical protein [Shigella dysenteriae]OYI38859.1 hypothetical protein CI695_21370 [Shigella sonnei]EEU9363380.1 hypothetical protein [Escherichia coli]EEW1719909.1 hypothetical protein [Escherichia coli]
MIVYKGNGDHNWVLADKKRAYLNDKRDVVQVGYGVCIGLMMLRLSSKRLPEGKRLVRVIEKKRIICRLQS